MRIRKMGAAAPAAAISPSLNRKLAKNPNHSQHGPVIDEIEGVIKVYKDGHVERPQIVPCVDTSLATDLGVTSSDVIIDRLTNIWARLYVPNRSSSLKLPLVVYFHGGGFCVGSADWVCYHEFLAGLSTKANCLIMSVNYRLAPENPLPAAYDDGIRALIWLKNSIRKIQGCDWWAKDCDFSRVFVAGDSAGGNIAYHVAARLISANHGVLRPLMIKGVILIQPFFGGEARVESELRVAQPTRSLLSLAAADAYWRMALPRESNRDHPFCNPTVRSWGGRTLVCVAEMDVLRDRDLAFCDALEKKVGKKKVERVVYRGVGHAFQILGKSQIAQTQTLEMMSRINAFVNDPL